MIAEFFKNNAIGWYLSAAACLCALIFVIIYGVRGGDGGGYSPVSGVAVAMIIIGILLNIGVLVKDFGIGAFLPYLFYLITFGVLFNSEMAFLSNVGFGVDGSVVDGGFIAMCIFLAFAMIASFAACIMKLTKKA